MVLKASQLRGNCSPATSKLICKVFVVKQVIQHRLRRSAGGRVLAIRDPHNLHRPVGAGGAGAVGRGVRAGAPLAPEAGQCAQQVR